MCSSQRFVFEIQYWIFDHIIEWYFILNLINPYPPEIIPSLPYGATEQTLKLYFDFGPHTISPHTHEWTWLLLALTLLERDWSLVIHWINLLSRHQLSQWYCYSRETFILTIGSCHSEDVVRCLTFLGLILPWAENVFNFYHDYNWCAFGNQWYR